MKKLILLFLLLPILMVGQNIQQRFVYDYVSYREGDKIEKSEASNTIFLNYGGDNTVKVLTTNLSTIWFDKIVDGKEGVTENGLEFSYAVFKQRDTEFLVLIQVFKEQKYGIRFIFENSIIHFY